MKSLMALLMCVSMSVFAADADPAVASMAAVKDLGTVNGQALACGESAAAARAKALMLAHAPKTYAYGEAYQAATQAAFADQTRAKSTDCPDAAALAARLDQLAARLREVLPAAEAR